MFLGLPNVIYKIMGFKIKYHFIYFVLYLGMYMLIKKETETQIQEMNAISRNV